MRWLQLHSGAGWVLVHLRVAGADLTYDTVRPALAGAAMARFPRGVPRIAAGVIPARTAAAAGHARGSARPPAGLRVRNPGSEHRRRPWLCHSALRAYRPRFWRRQPVLIPGREYLPAGWSSAAGAGGGPGGYSVAGGASDL